MQNVHAGHRARMRKRFLRCGGAELPDHNILEMLLFYAVPRRDTNELAHKLLNNVGSLEVLFTTPKEELMSKYGLTEHLARYISGIGEICTSFPLMETDGDISDKTPLAQQFATRYRDTDEERMIATLINFNGACVYSVELKHRNGKVLPEGMRNLVAAAIRSRTAEVVLTLCLPPHTEWASGAFAFTVNALRDQGVSVAECVVAVDGRYELVKRREDAVYL